jgi:hypothetical protein
MSLRNWFLAAAAAGLVGSVLPATAQNTTPSEPSKPIFDLVENGYDFNKPETIPGFGTLPPAK